MKRPPLVREAGLYLAERTGASPAVVELFSVFHDAYGSMKVGTPRTDGGARRWQAGFVARCSRCLMRTSRGSGKPAFSTRTACGTLRQASRPAGTLTA